MRNLQHNRFLNALQNLFLAASICLCSISPTTANELQTDSIITRSVIIEANDSLTSIARRELGKSGLAAHLAAFNGMHISQKLTPGETVRIPLYAPIKREYATAVFVKGDVHHVRDDVNKSSGILQRDDKVHLHEILTTGADGFASLQFASGSVVNLQPQTQAQLRKLNCLNDDDNCLITIDAAQGEVFSDIKTRKGQPTEFHITTPYASAAVRGTKFDINAGDSSVIVGVTEGAVLISAQNQDQPLEEGFGSVTENGKPPSEPIALLPPPVYRYVPTRAALGDLVRWWEMSDVDNYTANISEDQEGSVVIADFSSDKGQLTINDIQAGDYFLSVRAIDTNGLKGYRSPTRITIAAIDTNIDPVETEISRSGDQFLIAVVAPPDTASGFEIQISNTPDFTDPLSVDTAASGKAIFKMENDKIYTRARVLLDPQTVSAFGDVTESN